MLTAVGRSFLKKQIGVVIIRTSVLLVLLYLSTRWCSNPYTASFDSIADTFPYGSGNASETVRAEVLNQLRDFQEGYTARNTDSAAEFADHLISKDNILILGTMPKEIYVGHEAATDLIQSDWAYWGDCTFLIDRVHVSSHGNVAWLATVGFVEFDLSRFLVLPLRLTGVLVHTDEGWKFQQLQYQFDLDLIPNLLLIVLILLLNIANAIVILIQLVLGYRRRRQTSPH